MAEAMMARSRAMLLIGLNPYTYMILRQIQSFCDLRKDASCEIEVTVDVGNFNQIPHPYLLS